LIEPYLDQHVIQQLINISAGWYLIEQAEDKLIFWDLRFGQIGMDLDSAPFLMSFDLLIDTNNNVTALKNDPNMDNIDDVFSDLLVRIKGN